MDLEIETIIIIFDINQKSNVYHPLTCSGGGGNCIDSTLKARQVKRERKIEAYCPSCNSHSQILYDSNQINILMKRNGYKELYNKLLCIYRDGKVENILNK